MDERTESLLYAAARRQHLVEKVLPALSSGKIVLCDRFVDSSLAYQGAGRRIGVNEIAELNEFATEGTTPDFTLYLDVDSDTGLRRIAKNRQNQIDRLDSEGLEFHQRVRHAYLKLVEEHPERIHKIDARNSFEEVLQLSYHAIINQFPQYFESQEGERKMKIILAIIQDKDSNRLSNELIDANIRATKLSSTGGFLKAGNSTFIVGIEDDRVEEALEIIKKHVSQENNLFLLQ